jgi:Ca2+:H+ antiporter
LGRFQKRGAYTRCATLLRGHCPLAIAGAVVELVGGPVLLVFTLTALALVGLAWVLGQATESVGHYAGPQIGDILNATFGNAEFIITVFALSAGLTRVVKASIIGSVDNMDFSMASLWF